MSSFENHLILVFGVSGAGKTATCLNYCVRNTDAVYVSASSILKNQTGQTTEQLRLSSASVIGQNQSILTTEIDKIRRSSGSSLLIVDAHAVIDNGVLLVPVSFKVIKSLTPTGVVLLEPPAKQVVAQRAVSDRPRAVKTIEQISRELIAERSAVQSYSIALNVPLITLREPNAISLASAIADITRIVSDKQ